MRHLCFCVSLFVLASTSASVSNAAERPNILWLTSEDHGPEMGCYGDKLARTPNVDALAAKGMIFRHAWSVAPVCAPARTAIITGMYPSSTGGLHMRSMVPMPAGMKLYPSFLRDAGYYCTNNSKTDYNVPEMDTVWDASSGKAHWKHRAADQPFFAIFNSTKSHESQIRTRPHQQITDPAAVRVPSYHPDTPEVRQDWAQYYDKVSEADADAGRHLREIEKAGLAGDTIVFYYGDHGSGMPRSKRWPCNSGLHVPMVVYFPEKWQHLAPKEYSAGGESNRLVSFVDLAPTVLSIAGVEPPAWMQGNAFAGEFQVDAPSFMFGERGRMDERMDLVRSVTDGRFVYLRNFHPHVSQAQRVDYQFQTPTTKVWFERFKAGRLNAAQSMFWSVPKASEELYDLRSDRDEANNLAMMPEHQETLAKLRTALRAHMLEVRDVCFQSESEMHAQSAGSSPYEVARDEAKYPLEKILAVAEVAASFDPSQTSALVEACNDSNASVRYWGALGLMIRGEASVRAAETRLVGLLDDESASVRIAAAEALCKYGDKPIVEKSRGVLAELASPEENGVLVAMEALSSIEALGEIATPILGSVLKLRPKGASPDGRYDSYIPRLLENLSKQPQS